MIGWVFAGLFSVVVGGFAHLMLTDGPPAGAPPAVAWSALAVFMLAAIGLLRHALVQPITSIRVGPTGAITLRRRWPLHAQTQERRAREVAGVELERSKDSDGDPYFRLWLGLKDGARFVVAEGHDETGIVAAEAQLRAALRRPS